MQDGSDRGGNGFALAIHGGAGTLRRGEMTAEQEALYRAGLARAGEGYFSPDGHSIIFQAVPYLTPSIFHHPKPDEDGYQIYLGALEDDAAVKMFATMAKIMSFGADLMAYAHHFERR